MEFLSKGEKGVVGIGLFWENKVRPDFPKKEGVGIEYGLVFVEFRKGCVFRSMFVGRKNVFARLFESAKTGKKGYSPYCENQWVRGVCGLLKGWNCSDCPSRKEELEWYGFRG